MFEPTIRKQVLRVHGSGVRWLSSGWNGGVIEADAAYNLSVPSGWNCRDIAGYVSRRLSEAKFSTEGPSLLTGVDLEHARGARLGSVVVIATAGVSNPAELPVNLDGAGSEEPVVTDREPVGTINVIVGVTEPLKLSAQVELLAGVAEAKTATLMQITGFTGTTTDAVIVGCHATGDQTGFTGSATPIGMEARACVRDAVHASLRSRYADEDLPSSVADAAHGVVTTKQAEVFTLNS